MAGEIQTICLYPMRDVFVVVIDIQRYVQQSLKSVFHLLFVFQSVRAENKIKSGAEICLKGLNKLFFQPINDIEFRRQVVHAEGLGLRRLLRRPTNPSRAMR